MPDVKISIDDLFDANVAEGTRIAHGVIRDLGMVIDGVTDVANEDVIKKAAVAAIAGSILCKVAQRLIYETIAESTPQPARMTLAAFTRLAQGAMSGIDVGTFPIDDDG